MPLRLSTRLRLLPLAVIILCVIWASLYAFEAVNDLEGGDEASLFIQPLFYLLLAVAIWAAIEAIVAPEESSEGTKRSPSSDDDVAVFGATGLSDYRRLALVLSLPLMVMATSVLGFALSAPAYVVILSWVMNECRWGVLLLMAILAIAAVVLFFKILLGVPLPLWPPMVG